MRLHKCFTILYSMMKLYLDILQFPIDGDLVQISIKYNDFKTLFKSTLDVRYLWTLFQIFIDDELACPLASSDNTCSMDKKHELVWIGQSTRRHENKTLRVLFPCILLRPIQKNEMSIDISSMTLLCTCKKLLLHKHTYTQTKHIHKYILADYWQYSSPTLNTHQLAQASTYICHPPTYPPYQSACMHTYIHLVTHRHISNTPS